VHSAEFKAQVLAECQQPGASVAAIALARALNVSLLRKWLVGHGIKRTGLTAPRTVTRKLPAAVVPAAASLQFVPVEVAPTVAADAAPAEAVPASRPGHPYRVQPRGDAALRALAVGAGHSVHRVAARVGHRGPQGMIGA
jgi:transposase-like protein